MDSKPSQKVRRDTFSTPRPLTRSEIASLRQDAISTSMEMKRLMAQRQQAQNKAMTILMEPEPMKVAAE